MRTSPSTNFTNENDAATRRVSFRLYISIDGTPTDMTSYVKSISSQRTAGDARAVASFASALASEFTITLVPADIDLGTNPIRSVVTLELGFNGEYVTVFQGMIQRVRRHASGEVVITTLDNALPLTRNHVKTPSYFSVNSAIYMRELLELAGVSARALTPDELLFALDFDAEENTAVISAARSVSDTNDNGLNQSMIRPHSWYDLDGKPFHYEMTESTRSSRLVVDPFTIVHYPDRATYDTYGIVDPNAVLTADNASSRQYAPTPSGYGGGSVINPTCLYFPAGFGGFKYWLCIQGYPKLTLGDLETRLWKSNGYTFLIPEVDAQSIKGDPIILVSDDGVTWAPPSFDNPLATRPTYSADTVVKLYNEDTRKYESYTIDSGEPRLGTFLCEPTMVYHDSKLYVVWREVNGKTEYWYYRYTSDGINWSAKARWIALSYQTGCVPTLAVRADGTLHVWWINRTSNPNKIYHSLVSGVGGTIYGRNVCTVTGIAPTRDPWRMSVVPDPTSATNGFCMCLTTCSINRLMKDTALHMASSITGETWKASVMPLVARSRLGWDNGGLVSGAFVNDYDSSTGATFDLWYTGYSNNESHGIGRTVVYQSLRSLGGTVPSQMPNGPVLYGPFVANKCIDGVTAADRSVLWPQASGDGERFICGGGWFAPVNATYDIRSAVGLLMEVNFGSNVKFILGFYASTLQLRMYRYEGGTWVFKRGAAIVLAGLPIEKYLWNSDSEYYLGFEIGSRWTGASPEIQLSVIYGTTSISTAVWTTPTGITNMDLFDALNSVSIVSTFSGQLHTTLFNNSFPGFRYDNLFVGLGHFPRTEPEKSYMLEKGLNTLVAAAFQGTDSWKELKSVAESEIGCISWDADNVLRFFNRHHYSLPENATVVKTITSSESVLNAIVVQDVKDIKNVLRVKVKTQELKSADDIWSLESPWVIKAGETVVHDVNIPGVLESVDAEPSFSVYAGATRYRAAFVVGYENGIPLTNTNGVDDSLGGAELFLYVTIVPYGKVVTVSIQNLSSDRDIALFDGNGNPYFYLWGRSFTSARFRSEESMVVEVGDTESIAAYGANAEDIDLAYLSDPTSAYDLAMYLLRRYRSGEHRIEDIRTVGDPLLEIGDRITITVPEMGVDDTFWTEKIEDTLSPEVGYTQKVDLAIADEGNWFQLDVSTLDSDSVLTY